MGMNEMKYKEAADEDLRLWQSSERAREDGYMSRGIRSRISLYEDAMEYSSITREQQCIKELYDLLERIEYGVKHHDLALLRVPRGATGCDMFQGTPPISRLMAGITDRYGDLIKE